MLVEAFAAGVPLVGSDSGEIPHVIGQTGVIVPEGNAAALAAALGTLLGDPSRRRHLALEGRQRALAEFAWPVVARRHIEFFERVLETKAGGRSAPHGEPRPPDDSSSHMADTPNPCGPTALRLPAPAGRTGPPAG